MKEFIVKQKTLTGIKNWLNQLHGKKKSGVEFFLTDVQHYVRRGNLPKYLGGYTIERDKTVKDVKLYNIVKES